MAVITLEEAGFPDIAFREPQRVLYALGGAYLEWEPWLRGNFDSSYHPTETEIKLIYGLHGTGATRWEADGNHLVMFDSDFYGSMYHYFHLSLQLKLSEMSDDASAPFHFTKEEIIAEMIRLLGGELTNLWDQSARHLRYFFPKEWATLRYRLVHDLPRLSYYASDAENKSSMITETGTLIPSVYDNGNGLQWDESRGNFYQLTWTVPSGYRFIRGKLWFYHIRGDDVDFGTGASLSSWSSAHECSTNVFRFDYQFPSNGGASAFIVRAIAEFEKTTD